MSELEEGGAIKYLLGAVDEQLIRLLCSLMLVLARSCQQLLGQRVWTARAAAAGSCLMQEWQQMAQL